MPAWSKFLEIERKPTFGKNDARVSASRAMSSMRFPVCTYRIPVSLASTNEPSVKPKDRSGIAFRSILPRGLRTA